jgi:hypothetical protein
MNNNRYWTKARLEAPKGAQIISWKGKYPVRLVDLHMYIFNWYLYTRPDVLDLRAFKPYSEEIVWTISQHG